MWIKAVRSSFAEIPQAEIDLVRDLATDNAIENHCIPILDKFSDPEIPRIVYIVFDHAELYAKKYFRTVFCVLDFMHQILEVCLDELKFTRC